MQVEALKDQFIYGRPVKTGQVINIGKAYADKLIREGLVRLRETKADQLETKCS
jgi:hypothetical protein